MNSKYIILAAFVVVFSLLGLSQSYGQSDQLNLEEGFGAEVDDAYPTAYRNREFLSFVRYERSAKGKDLVFLNPLLEFGLFRNTELSIAVPIKMGNGDRTASGNIIVEALYNFNTEGLLVPAFSAVIIGEIPSGFNTAGFDYGFKLLATKTVGNKLDRLHFNFRYFINSEPELEFQNGSGIQWERSNMIKGVVGYSGRLGPVSVLVVDYVYEQQRIKNNESHIFEVAYRRHCTPALVVSLGAGAGIGPDSPLFRSVLGIQHVF